MALPPPCLPLPLCFLIQPPNYHSPLVRSLFRRPFRLSERLQPPFLGSRVTALLYDVTRFEDLSIEELREHWPRPGREWGEHRRESRKGWIERNPGIWQYLKLVEEFKAGSFDHDEVRILTEGMKRLPNLRTVRLAFAFQKQRLTTDREMMSPLRRYTDVEYVTRTPVRWMDQRHMADERMVKNISEAIMQSGVCIEELDLWRDCISIPLSAFNFESRLVECDFIFSRLAYLTIKFSHSSMESASDLGCFWKLLGVAKRLRKLQLSIDGIVVPSKEKRSSLRFLIGGLMITQFRELEWVDQPHMFGPTRLGMCEYDPPWPGTVWILERREGT